MKTVYNVNDKGGVGKTILSYHLAAALAKKGSTLLIDNDPQRSAYRLTTLAQNVLDQIHEEYEMDLEDYEAAGNTGPAPVEPATELSFATLAMPDVKDVSEFEEQAKNFDYLVVDTPSGIDRNLLNSIMNSDSLVIIPTANTLTELLATSELVAAFEGSKAQKRVLFRRDSREREITREELDASGLAGMNFKTSITTLKAYDNTIYEGSSIVDFELKPSDRTLLRARNQMLGLLSEVLEVFDAVDSGPVGAVSGS